MRRHAALTAVVVAGFMCPAILTAGAAAAPKTTTTVQTVTRMDVAHEPGSQPRGAPMPSGTEQPR